MASLAMARVFQDFLSIISGIFSYGHLEKFVIPRGSTSETHCGNWSG
jgi:hypothetical protein